LVVTNFLQILTPHPTSHPKNKQQQQQQPPLGTPKSSDNLHTFIMHLKPYIDKEYTSQLTTTIIPHYPYIAK
jgi:hypothetical protein